MKQAYIESAAHEAQEFLVRYAEYTEARATELKQFGSCSCWNIPKQSGALKRASMDLTRALAKMRQGK